MTDILIVGAGPSGLFAADHLSQKGYSVAVIEQMPSPARKFLMAGRGGLNITHSEDLAQFYKRYREAEEFLSPKIDAFTPDQLREWCHALGQETFVGSSGRVFPRSMKASPLLRALLHRLEQNGVQLRLKTNFIGIQSAGRVEIETAEKKKETLSAKAVLLALGGASWPRLGSNAAWVPILEAHGITISSFQPANCGFHVSWSTFLKDRFAGTPLKRITLFHEEVSAKGEVIISEKGLEGGAIYALSAALRQSINSGERAQVLIDLRPDLELSQLIEKLSRPRKKQTLATFLKKQLKLKSVELALLHEAGPIPSDVEALANLIKAVPVELKSPYSIDRAISSAGGIQLCEVDTFMMLKKLPGVFVAGEMLDWEAPTGGYLLQACFATGARAALGIENFLDPNGAR